MKRKQQSNSPGLPKPGLLLLILLLVGNSALAQTSFNRWDAQPMPTPKPTASAKQRGSQIVQAKVRQDSLARIQQVRNDSLRLVADLAQIPLLPRGIGRRIKENQTVSGDNNYYEYIRKGIRYPSEAIRAETEGQVIMRLKINTSGNVVSAIVIDNTIPPASVGRDEMVRQADFLLHQLRFEPAASNTEEELSVAYKIQ
ncbi:energy transducer TonB [uncultured Hymenobacter sp.]|uniref:energy transducer TonB n=1 Tax=uncultured Hymenobacter sp. TaxID=170016 RepID=UPI0035CB68B3